jgi:uncharacterized membrane protein (DUF373 family)
MGRSDEPVTISRRDPGDEGVSRPGGTRDRLTRGLLSVEDIIYFAIAAVLVVATAALLVSASYNFVLTLGGDLREGTIRLIDSVLLVMMLVEILGTINISLRQHILAPEQFLIIGIIAAVRRMLIITAEQTEFLNHPETFQLILWELLLLGGLILVLAVAVYLLRRARPQATLETGA